MRRFVSDNVTHMSELPQCLGVAAANRNRSIASGLKISSSAGHRVGDDPMVMIAIEATIVSTAMPQIVAQLEACIFIAGFFHRFC